MKIGNNIESLSSDLQARAANGSRSPLSSGKNVEGVDGTDRIELSSTSRNLSTGVSGRPESDSVRTEKVAEVRQAIQEGKFHVSAQAVADKMITEAAELIEAITTGGGASR